MGRFLKTHGFPAVVAAFGLFSLQGCLPIYKDHPGNKFGKKNCCDSCQSAQKGQEAGTAVGIAVPTASPQSKVLPDEINAGNYQKMLKNLEDEVTQSGPNP